MSDKIEVYKRIRQVQEWIMEGHSTTDIVYNSKDKWSVDERTGYRYIKKAFELFITQTENETNERRAFHIQSRMRLYKESLKDKRNSKISLDILDSIAKLESLFVHNVDLTTKGKSIVPQYNLKNLTEEELRKLDELTSKLGS